MSNMKKGCAYGPCGKNVLPNPKSMWPLCLAHTKMGDFIKFGNLEEVREVRKEYIEEEENGSFRISDRFREEIQRQSGFCVVCEKHSECVLKKWGSDETVCHLDIQKKDHYNFKGERIRGDLLIFKEVMYANVCKYHDKPLCDIGSCPADFVADAPLCKDCITGLYESRCQGSCGRMIPKKAVINAVDGGTYCISCVDRNGIYLHKKHKVRGKSLYREKQEGKGCSFLIKAKGFEYKCKDCRKFFSTPTIEHFDFEGETLKFCPHCRSTVW